MSVKMKSGELPPLARGQRLKLGAVSYLNTKPLVYGLEQGMMQDEIELHFGYPGEVAAQLLRGELDAGLVPVALLPQLPAYRIISDYGIAADGPVASVALFSQVPLEQLKTVLLDYQSRTSVLLAQYLLTHYWKLSPAFEQAAPDFIDHISGTTGAVIIGDRALKQIQQSAYVYDLATAWKAYTGLPFVFAAWVSRVDVSDDFIRRFNEANALGLQHLPEVIRQHPFTDYDLHHYYTHNIRYRLDEHILTGLQYFLDHVAAPAVARNTTVPAPF